MKFTYSQYTFYTYMKVGRYEDYHKCVKKLIDKMKRKGYKYDPTEFGDCRKEYQDANDNGSVGSPMYFIKK